MKAYELIDHRDKLSRGVRARDAHGHPVEPRDPSAASWSIPGAVERCYDGDAFPMKLTGLRMKFGDVQGWSDSLTWLEVKAYLEKRNL